jgi:sulfur relay protein TusB/DsrH
LSFPEKSKTGGVPVKLGVFFSDYRTGSDILDRLSAEKMGVIFVGNGVYHAAVKENGKSSPILDKSLNFYVLTEDLETRGFTASDLDSRVKSVTYDDVVDIIFNDYEKIIWL